MYNKTIIFYKNTENLHDLKLTEEFLDSIQNQNS